MLKINFTIINSVTMSFYNIIDTWISCLADDWSTECKACNKTAMSDRPWWHLPHTQYCSFIQFLLLTPPHAHCIQSHDFVLEQRNLTGNSAFPAPNNVSAVCNATRTAIRICYTTGRFTSKGWHLTPVTYLTAGLAPVHQGNHMRSPAQIHTPLLPRLPWGRCATLCETQVQSRTYIE